MSFETEKRKLRNGWEKNEQNLWEYTKADLQQNNKSAQIQQVIPNSVMFKKIRTIDSGWLTFTTYGLHKIISYSYTAIIPESMIGAVKINYLLSKPTNWGFNYNYITNIVDVSSGIKSVTWDFFVDIILYESSVWDDFQVKFLITFINPLQLI